MTLLHRIFRPLASVLCLAACGGGAVSAAAASETTDSTATFTAVAGEGKTITIKYVLGKDYMLHMQLQANGLQGLFAPNINTMDIAWEDRCRQQEKGFMFENRYTTLTYHLSDGGAKNLSENGDDDKTIDEKHSPGSPPPKTS